MDMKMDKITKAIRDLRAWARRRSACVQVSHHGYGRVSVQIFKDGVLLKDITVAR